MEFSNLKLLWAKPNNLNDNSGYPFSNISVLGAPSLEFYKVGSAVAFKFLLALKYLIT